MCVTECRLLKGSVAFAAQLTLAICILGSLLYKRQREHPKRPLRIWAMDVSKQAISATTCHIINMTFAVLAYRNVSSEEESDETEASECSWYFVQFNVDNILGVPLTVLTHTAILAGARAYAERPGIKHRLQQNEQITFLEIVASCGSYGIPPKISWWAVQVLEWIVAVLVARSVSGSLVVLLSDVALKHVGALVDNIFCSQPVLHLYFAIVVYPLAGSTTVAWILDGLLKKSNKSSSLNSELTEHILDYTNDCEIANVRGESSSNARV